MAAFEELYGLHAAAVGRVVSSIGPGQQQRADVVQEAFLRALEHLPTLRSPSHFRAWLFAIARHAAVDQLRHSGRETLSPEGGADEGATHTPGPEEIAELTDLARFVRAGMGQRSKRDAMAVALVTHLGLSPRSWRSRSASRPAQPK